MVFPEGMSPGQRNALLRLKRLLDEEGAARVGETAVVSIKVHVQDVSNPDEVAAVVTGDAGRVFYNRENPGEILHIDVFHSPGSLDPKFVGRRLLSSLSGIRFEPGPGVWSKGLEPLLSFIDIQTGSGGGRLDGDLTYGREEGVRKAHTTHVHIACLMKPEIMASVFTMVATVESAAIESGLELRKVKRVRLTKGGGPLDMTDYQASGDSLLRQVPSQGQDSAAHLYRQEALARKVAHDIGSAHDSTKLLESLAKGLRSGDFARLRLNTDKSPDEIRKLVTRAGLAVYDGCRYTLTQDGMMALSFLKAHSSEVEAYLRRLLWSLPSRKIPAGERKGVKPEPSVSRGRGIALPPVKGEHLPSLAIPETIAAWKSRTMASTSTTPLQEAAASSGLLPDPPSHSGNSPGTQASAPQAGSSAWSGTAPQSPTWADLRFGYSRERRGMPIILLIDASASMAGRRIRAAKELARHLVLASKEKVSIVAFQDSEVKVVSGFTRNRRKIEEGLAGVHALGLTPLAKGLEKALELSVRSSKKPLILAITDGIPTVPSKSLSPVQDALDAAKMIARRGVRFGCVGLEPNRGFLKQMVANAKGTLYIVEELEASTLAAIAKRESLR